jgi:hypothetical protein
MARASYFETALSDRHLLKMRMRRAEDFDLISDVDALLLAGSQPIGVFEGQIVHFSECPGESLWLEMDGHSQELSDCYCDLFSKTGELDGVEDLGFEDLLQLHQVEIDKTHRGQGLGNQLLASILAFFSRSCAHATMKPFPLQWSGWLGEECTPKRKRVFKAQQQKLVRYYAPLRFQKVPWTKERYIRRLLPDEVILGRSREQWKRCRKFDLPGDIRFEPRGSTHRPDGMD